MPPLQLMRHELRDIKASRRGRVCEAFFFDAGGERVPRQLKIASARVSFRRCVRTPYPCVACVCGDEWRIWR